MREAPSLITLCLDSVKDLILYGDEDISILYQLLPSQIIDGLIPRLPALALLKFEDALPSNYESEDGNGSGTDQRKSKRLEDFDTAWMKLYKSSVPSWITIPKNCSHCRAAYKFENWREQYWNCHIQMCLQWAAAIAGNPNFKRSLGEVMIEDSVLKSMGFKKCGCYSEVDFSTVAYHCQHFGLYARCLTLSSVLLQEETSHLLRKSKLEALEIHDVKSKKQVDGLHKILSQSVTTLVSLRFENCQIPSKFFSKICNSLLAEDRRTHKIKHFRVNSSRSFEAGLPARVVSFLSSARSLCTVDFCDSNLSRDSAKKVFNELSEASSDIAVLDLSENDITGWLPFLMWKKYSTDELCTLKSLRVLRLRSCNLQLIDAARLNYELFKLTSLKTLNLSDNPIKDDGLERLMPYFTRMADEESASLVNLNLEECQLTGEGVISLLRVLSSSKKPLNSLRIGENNLGSEVGGHLGKYICTGVRELHFNNIGIESSGFLEAREQLTEGVKLAFINLRENDGGLGAAEFISKLLLSAPGLIKLDASYNALPAEAMAMIGSSVKSANGKLRYLDLSGNSLCGGAASREMLKKSVEDKHIEIYWPA